MSHWPSKQEEWHRERCTKWGVLLTAVLLLLAFNNAAQKDRFCILYTITVACITMYHWWQWQRHER